MCIVILDIGSYSVNVLQKIKSLSVVDATAQQHPVILAQKGLLSPGVCQDFNAPPPFIKKTTSGTAVIAKDLEGNIVPSTTAPNEIIIPPGKVDQITVSIGNY
jgi:hypothetical protein